MFKLKSKQQDKLATPKSKGRAPRERDQTVLDPSSGNLHVHWHRKGQCSRTKASEGERTSEGGGDPGKDKPTQAAELGS